MRSGDAVPRVGPDTDFTEMLREMTGKGLGFTAIVDDDQQVLGIFTDGDLRRLIERGADLRGLIAQRGHAPQAPRLMRVDALAVDAADRDGAAPHHQRAGGRCARRAWSAR